ncbi:MAG: protocatechuate 3,4-dioxygenase [Acetobacteraceae bacterium]|nr:protocatechuate 3,4-dioxygenase [Acetobacteraceae bacterium]
MASLVAGFGSSHSPMLAAQAEDWIGGAFLNRDRARQFVDFDGVACRYDDLLERAPEDAAARIAPDLLRRRHAEITASIARLRGDIAAAELDALIVIGDDQEEMFDHANMPAIGVYYGETIGNAKAGPAEAPLDRARMRFQEGGADKDYPCHGPLARHLIDSLQHDEFDLSAMARTGPGKFEGHAISFVHRFLMGARPVPVVPVFLNAYYPPNQPGPGRCFALGEALTRAIHSFEGDGRIGVLASGGLSHFVVDEDFDHAVIDALKRHDANFFRTAPLYKLQSGSSEIRNWICLAGAVGGLDLDWVSYTPGYRTPALTGTGLCFASFRAM